MTGIKTTISDVEPKENIASRSARMKSRADYISRKDRQEINNPNLILFQLSNENELKERGVLSKLVSKSNHTILVFMTLQLVHQAKMTMMALLGESHHDEEPELPSHSKR